MLPIGISFYTFNSISYTIDIYRRQVRAERELRRLRGRSSLFFPHLIAGPIVRYRDIDCRSCAALAPRLTSQLAASRRCSSSPAACSRSC